MKKNPNDYTRDDVIKLARKIAPLAWAIYDADMDVNKNEYNEKYVQEVPLGYLEKPVTLTTKTSITLAANILVAGYRDCKF